MADVIIKGRPTMAEIVGVTVNGLIKMEQRGLPVMKKTGEGNWYHLPTVFTWRLADQQRQLLDSTTGESGKQIFARKALAEMRRAEIEVGLLEGSIVKIEHIRFGMEGLMVNQRTLAMSVASQIGREIDEPDMRTRVVQIVDRRMREMLEAIARYDPVVEPSDDAEGTGDDGDQDEPAAAPASPTTQRQSVGRTQALPQPRRRRVRPVAE